MINTIRTGMISALCLAGLTVLARAVVQPAGILDYDVNYDDTFATNGGMWSDMILWERPAHGRVFAVGSVLASHMLHSDENFSNFLLNALNAVGIAADPADEKRFRP